MKAIYLEPDEEITSVVDRLKELDDEDVAIIVPKRAALLQSIVNLKLLRYQAEQQGKRISIVTSDKTGRNLAAAVGLTVHQKLPEGGKAVKESAVQETGDPVKIGFKKRQPEEPKKPSDEAAASADIGYKKGKDPELVKREIAGVPADEANTVSEAPEPAEGVVVPEAESEADAEEAPDQENASPEPVTIPVTRATQDEAPPPDESQPSDKRFSFTLPGLPRFSRPSLRMPKWKGARSGGRKRWKLIGAIAALVILLTGGTAAAVVLPSATVTIIPRTDPFKAEIPVRFSTTAPQADAEENTVPARTVEVTQEGSLEARATGRSIGGEPARGEITVVNELNRNQPLVIRTRFQAPDGRLFRSQSGIVVPAGGTTTVQVVADEGGTDGNLPADTRLSIPGLRSTTAVYGQIDRPLTGGTDADSTTISQQDIDRARARLGQHLAREGLKEAEDQAAVDFTVNPEIAAITVLESESDPDAGASAERFTISGQARITYFSYEEEDLEHVLDGDLEAKIPGGTKLVDERSETFQVREKSAAQLSTLLIIDTFTASGISAERIAEDIAGKRPEEAERIIKETGKATDVTIDLAPFWVRSVPGDAGKVRVRLEARPAAGASPSPGVTPGA
ncbi:MAG: baseplate J/gp47 family protein [bacterium]|nr:baseplate J/gp47 family protein [bacterium]